MESWGSLLHSQELVACPYLKPKIIQPVHQHRFYKIYLNIILWEIGTGQQVAKLHDSYMMMMVMILILSSQILLRLPRGLFPSGFAM